jgi:hypothetical protein
LAAGLPTHFTPHALRHTFASLLAAQGKPLQYIQQQLGHRNITTTMVYAKWFPTAIRGVDDLDGHPARPASDREPDGRPSGAGRNSSPARGARRRRTRRPCCGGSGGAALLAEPPSRGRSASARKRSGGGSTPGRRGARRLAADLELARARGVDLGAVGIPVAEELTDSADSEALCDA